MKEETREPGEPQFHYNREERTALLPDSIRDRQRNGVFRGNRSLLITLIDVVFLVILVLVFSVVSRVMGDATIIRGYSISAKASVFDDRVLVSIKIRAKKDFEIAEQLRIRISYPEGNERVEVGDFLPERAGKEQIYRGALPHDAGQRKVVIVFFAGANRGSMTATIRAE